MYLYELRNYVFQKKECICSNYETYFSYNQVGRETVLRYMDETFDFIMLVSSGLGRLVLGDH